MLSQFARHKPENIDHTITRITREDINNTGYFNPDVDREVQSGDMNTYDIIADEFGNHTHLAIENFIQKLDGMLD